MIDQLTLWDAPSETSRPPLGSTFQELVEGSNPYMFLGKVGCNYRHGMNIWEELFYWHCIKAEASHGKVLMTKKVIGYAGGADLIEGTEDDDC